MDIKITGEYITLGQLLKMTDFIQSGGSKICGKIPENQSERGTGKPQRTQAVCR